MLFEVRPRSMATRGLLRMHYTIEPEGTKVVAHMGQEFVSSVLRAVSSREGALRLEAEAPAGRDAGAPKGKDSLAMQESG